MRQQKRTTKNQTKKQTTYQTKLYSLRPLGEIRDVESIGWKTRFLTSLRSFFHSRTWLPQERHCKLVFKLLTINWTGGSNPYLSSSPPRWTNSPFTLKVFSPGLVPKTRLTGTRKWLVSVLKLAKRKVARKGLSSHFLTHCFKLNHTFNLIVTDIFKLWLYKHICNISKCSNKLCRASSSSYIYLLGSSRNI